MKSPLFVITLLLMGLLAGCASTASGQEEAVVTHTRAPVPGQTPALPASPHGLSAAVTLTATPSATPEPPASPTQSMPTHTAAAAALISTPVLSPVSASLTPTGSPTATPEAGPISAPAPVSQNGAGQEELISQGMEVYKQQYCGVCHQLSAAETGGTFGPTHDGMGTTAEQRIQATDYRGAAATAGEYIHESIVSPDAYLVPGYEVTSHHMPAYTHLGEGDIQALVQMLLYQK